MARLIFKALGKSYSFPTDLGDITFKAFIDYLEKILIQEPELLTKLKQTYTAENDIQNALQEAGNDITAKQLEEVQSKLKEIKEEREAILEATTVLIFATEFLPYYAKVVAHFTGLPFDVIIGKTENPPIQKKDLEGLYWSIQKALQITDEKYIPYFAFEDETYYLPKQLMKGATVIEFIESAQFQAQLQEVKNGYWKSMIDVVAVLCKRKGEQYSDEIYQRNKEIFKRLPMDVVANVAFFLRKQSNKLNNNSQISTLSRQLSKLKQGLKNSRVISAGT